MRFAMSLKNLSLSLALISLMTAGAASAQSLTGVNATLNRGLDSKTAAAGQAVTAKLDGSVKTAEGITLPRGTELIGKIAEAKGSHNGGPASVTLLFTTAKLKDGREIPVKVTLVGAYPATDSDDPSDSSQLMGSAPSKIPGDETISQTPGALDHVSLTSAVKNTDSGTFARTSGNFRLNAGTYLQVGIAPAAGGTAIRAAE